MPDGGSSSPHNAGRDALARLPLSSAHPEANPRFDPGLPSSLGLRQAVLASCKVLNHGQQHVPVPDDELKHSAAAHPAPHVDSADGEHAQVGQDTEEFEE